MQQVQYNKTCITLKRILRIDWKCGYKAYLYLLNDVIKIASQNHEMDV